MISVQILRGVAALLVVLFHISNKAASEGLLSYNGFAIGESGVDLFFIISGFIMAFITNNKEVTTSDFIINRIARIFPLYWIVTTIALLAYIVFPTAIKWGGDLDISIFDSYSLLPSNSAILVAVGWTLRYELLFYAIFALCIPLRSVKLISCSLLLSTFAILSLFINKGLYASFVFNPMLLEFTLGIAAFYIYKNNIGKMVMALPVGILALISFGANFPSGDWQRVLCMGLPMFFIFIGFISIEDKFKQNTSMLVQKLKFIGDSSYSLYLTHFFTIGAASRLIKIFIPQGNLILLFILGFIASLIVGFFCNHLIEKNVAIKKLTKYRYQ